MAEDFFEYEHTCDKMPRELRSICKIKDMEVSQADFCNYGGKVSFSTVVWGFEYCPYCGIKLGTELNTQPTQTQPNSETMNTFEAYFGTPEKAARTLDDLTDCCAAGDSGCNRCLLDGHCDSQRTLLQYLQQPV